MSIEEDLIERIEDLKIAHREQFGGDLPDRSPLAERALAYGLVFLAWEIEHGRTFSDRRGLLERRTVAREALEEWFERDPER